MAESAEVASWVGLAISVIALIVSAIVSYRQQDRQLRVSVRPVLVFEYLAETNATGQKKYFWFLVNVGNGPAVNVFARAWIEGPPDAADRKVNLGSTVPVLLPPIAKESRIKLHWMNPFVTHKLEACYEAALGGEAGRFAVTMHKDRVRYATGADWVPADGAPCELYYRKEEYTPSEHQSALMQLRG
jgi:hypothetical protein